MMQNGALPLAGLALWLLLAVPGVTPAAPTLTRQQAIEQARETVATQEKIPPEKLQLDSTRAVDWPDSSLGCPQPGVMYMQMIIPGYQVILLDTHSGKTYDVHLADKRAIICAPPPKSGESTEKNLRFGQRWQQSQQAQALLAQRLAVSPEAIRIVGSRRVPRKEAPPACGALTGDTLQLIELSYKNTIYRYALIDGRLAPCD